MLRFLKKSYPFNTDLIHNAKIIFFISVVFGFFMFFLQPFNIIEFSFKSRLTISGITATITFATLSFNLLVLPSYFSNIFMSEKWNIFKEIIWNTWMLAILVGSYFLYFQYAELGEFTGITFAKIILIAIVPISTLVFFNQNRLLKQNLNDAVDLNTKILSKLNSENDIILFESSYKKDSISLAVNTILLVKSAGNYIEVFWREKNKTNKQLVRMKFSETEEILKNYNFIFKCHRSFLINKNFVDKAKGNSQGLKVSLKKVDFLIPVSRPYVAKLKELI